MAQYISPLVLTPPIPARLMTPIERFILTTVFQHEEITDGDALYLYAEDGIDDELRIDRAAFDRIADAAEPGTDQLIMRIDMDIRTPGQRDDPFPIVCFINRLDPLHVLQGLVKRHSDELPVIVIHQAFTCSKMRPDGFGGAATVISATSIENLCTTSWAREHVMAVKAATAGALACEPAGRP